MKSCSPRGYVLIRMIQLQLINAHQALRICEFVSRGQIQTATSYKRLKQAMNKSRSTRQFMLEVHETWKYLQVSDSSEVESPPRSPPAAEAFRSSIPARNRIRFFNVGVGKEMRLSNINHPRVSIPKSHENPQRCLLCQMRTTVMCSLCEVRLCANTFSNNRLSCFKRFHTQRKVNIMHIYSFIPAH